MSELLSWSAADDATILRQLIALHAPARDPLVIADVTANDGSMWAGTGFAPWRFDLAPATRPHVAADCRALPLPDGCLDVITFDPPHVPGKGTRHTGTDWAARYGLGRLPTHRGPGGVVALFAPFLREAARVLRRGGIVLAKLSNGVYQDRLRWHTVLFVLIAAFTPGLVPCDEHLKVRPGPATAQSAARRYHTRRAHSSWIVVRKGSCQGPGVARLQQGSLLLTEVLA